MHKWTSGLEGIEATAVDEWSRKLAGLSGEEIKRGLDDWNEDWPPSADEFRKCCLGTRNRKNDHGLDYVPQVYRGTPQRDKSRLLSSDERDASRKEATKAFGKLVQALKAGLNADG